jgi:pimeloyl-ACP methyl ester carboxylesterase
MLHGFGTTDDMWGHLASALIEDHMIVVPDLRGLALSSKPDGGYDKKNQAALRAAWCNAGGLCIVPRVRPRRGR